MNRPTRFTPEPTHEPMAFVMMVNPNQEMNDNRYTKEFEALPEVEAWDEAMAREAKCGIPSCKTPALFGAIDVDKRRIYVCNHHGAMWVGSTSVDQFVSQLVLEEQFQDFI